MDFFETVLGYDARICLSLTTDMKPMAIGFGGFFSCLEGKPQSTPYSVQPHFHGPNYPQNCPTGYSEHTLSFINDCYIRQCTNSSSFKANVQLPLVGPSLTDSSVLFKRDSSDNTPSPAPNNSISGSAIAAIILGVALAALLVFIVVYILKKGRASANQDTSPNDQQPLLETESQPPNYQTLPSVHTEDDNQEN